MRSDIPPAHPGSGDQASSGPALYRERLWPGPWVWLCAGVAAASLGIAYGAVWGVLTGWAVAALVTAVALLVIWRTSPTVEVGPDAVSVDRASLPWWAAGHVLELDAAGVRLARGPDGDRTAFCVVRPGITAAAVVIEVTDPADPHATWLIGSRNAEAMARAMHQARGRLTP